jgi:hypothetical protein
MGAGGRKNYDLSARDFKAPLLRALGDLTNGTADTPVRYKDTWAPVCGALGITLDQYGTVENGKTQVQTWIGWAFRHLKNEDLGNGVGRGKWALTESGIEAYKALLAATGSDSPSVPAEALAAKDDDSAAEPAPAAPAPVVTIGIPFNVGPEQDSSGYHTDPYIRALAVRSTKCFGCYTPRSSVCGGCTLNGACQNLVAAELSALAGQLAHEDEQAAKAALAPKPKVKAKPEAPEDDSTHAINPDAVTWDAEALKDAESLVAHVEAKCGKCGQTIEVGSNCFWVRTKGDRKGTLLHEGCI